MSVASLTRTRLLATATIVLAAILFGWPSAYDLISGSEYPSVPSGFIIADLAAREDLALSRLNLPDGASLPPAHDRESRAAWLSRLASLSDRRLDELVTDAIQHSAYARQQRLDDLFGELQHLDFDNAGNFSGYGAGSRAGATGSGGGSGRGAVGSGGGPGAGAGGGSGAQGPSSLDEGLCEGCDSVYGGPRLPDYSEIPIPLGHPSAGGSVVFTPDVEDDRLVVLPELETPPTTIKTFGDDPNPRFDPTPKDPESPAPVPEPATLVLTGLGLSGLVAKARARRQRSV